MRITILLITFLLPNYFLYAQSKPGERFAGLHVDFHATMNDSSIGKTFTAEMIDSLLSIAKPDFIQVDCKGHPGVTSYPTKVGTHAPNLQKDILKIWREVTTRHKVALYVHYSGVWDSMAIVNHPWWAKINRDGKPDIMANSVFSNYVDSLVIPEIKELATEYKVDGIWVDGDCWTLSPDYSDAAVSKFKAETGNDAPKSESDPHYFEWMEFNRKSFRNYITRYVNAAHEAMPSFKATSNWSFSSMMPERVDVPVDFLSGDVAGTNGVYSSSFESRCLAYQGKPWDLMSWAFGKQDDWKAAKSVPQILQEASQVLAMGGGYQTYWEQNRDGSVETYQFRNIEKIIQFCKDRKPYTFEGVVVPQIGLLFSTYAWRRIPSEGLYRNYGQGPMKGVLNMITDNRLPVDIMMDHQLKGRMDKYSLLIIPEWKNIDPEIRDELLKYVRNGGNLLVVGATAVKDFAEPLGVNIAEPVQTNSIIFAGLNGNIIQMKTNYQTYTTGSDAKQIGIRLTEDDWRFATKDHFSVIRQLGKGKIGGIFMDMGDYYSRYRNSLSSELIRTVIESMVPAFISKITSSDGNMHQVVTKKNGLMYVHLINTNGPHNNPNVLIYDNVAPVKNIQLELTLPQKPAAIKLQPANRPIAFTYKNGKAFLTVPEVPIYSIVEIRQK